MGFKRGDDNVEHVQRDFSYDLGTKIVPATTFYAPTTGSMGTLTLKTSGAVANGYYLTFPSDLIVTNDSFKEDALVSISLQNDYKSMYYYSIKAAGELRLYTYNFSGGTIPDDTDIVIKYLIH